MVAALHAITGAECMIGKPAVLTISKIFVLKKINWCFDFCKNKIK